MKQFCLLLVAILMVTCSVHASVSSFQTQERSVILIDPGHGGEDGGTSGAEGSQEADLNLAISLRIRDLLLVLGYTPVLTRTEDTSVGEITGESVHARKAQDLKNRVRFVNAFENGILVSIHQNYFEQSKYDGAQVFYAKTEGSRGLAEVLQNTLRQVLDNSNRRECKPSDRVYLMEHIKCPAILLECGFISNSQEEQRLNTPQYQQKIAAAVVFSILSYENEGVCSS